MQIDTAQESDIDEIVVLDALVDEGDPDLIYFKKLTSTTYSVDQEAH